MKVHSQGHRGHDVRFGSQAEILRVSTASPLYPRKQTCEQTSLHVCFGPKADLAPFRSTGGRFPKLVVSEAEAA